jgi:hypothetical protein
MILIARVQSLQIQFKLMRGTTVNSDELTNGTDLQNVQEHLIIDVPQVIPEASPLQNGQEHQNMDVPQDLTETNPLQNMPMEDSDTQNGELIKKYATDEEYNTAYDGVFKKISNWCEHAKIDTDWKLLRNNQVELRGAMKMLFLTKEDSKKLTDIIDEHAEIINERQNSERMEKDKVFENNYNQYKEKVIETCEKANATTLFKEGRDLLIKLQDEIKPVQLKR